MKRLIVAIVIVIMLIIGLIGGYIFLQNNSKQAAILQEEATKVAETDITKDEIDMNLKSSGKYAIVEETIKNYLNDARKIYLDVTQFCNNEQVSQMLSAENIQADPEKLTVVEQKLDEYEKKLDDYLLQIDNISSEINIMEKIDEKDLSNYYKDIYKNVMLNEATQEKLEMVKTAVSSAQEVAEERLDGMREVIDFLIENKKYWELGDGKIQFTNINKLTEYYQLLNGI